MNRETSNAIGKIMGKWLDAPAVVEQQQLRHKNTDLDGARTYAAIGIFYDCAEEVYRLGRTDAFCKIANETLEKNKRTYDAMNETTPETPREEAIKALERHAADSEFERDIKVWPQDDADVKVIYTGAQVDEIVNYIERAHLGEDPLDKTVEGLVAIHREAASRPPTTAGEVRGILKPPTDGHLHVVDSLAGNHEERTDKGVTRYWMELATDSRTINATKYANGGWVKFADHEQHAAHAGVSIIHDAEVEIVRLRKKAKNYRMTNRQLNRALLAEQGRHAKEKTVTVGLEAVVRHSMRVREELRREVDDMKKEPADTDKTVNALHGETRDLRDEAVGYRREATQLSGTIDAQAATIREQAATITKLCKDDEVRLALVESCIDLKKACRSQLDVPSHKVRTWGDIRYEVDRIDKAAAKVETDSAKTTAGNGGV